MRRFALCLLAFAAAATAQTDAPPDAAEQERILALVRQYAVSYRMPDVAYDQTITSFEAPAGSNKWHVKGGSDSHRMAHGGREYWCCGAIRVGTRTRKTPAAKWREVGYYSFDRFEALATKATIAWDRWETLWGRRFAVFHYSVSQPDSNWGMDSARQQGSDWTFIISGVYVPYSGSVYVDPATGAIWRITALVTEIPARFKFRYISTIDNYGPVTIGTTQYLLPMTYSSMYRRDTDWRHERVFSNYHKFDADSSITFFGADSSIIYKK